MDFHQLLARMQQLDQPVGEQTTNEMGCGGMPPAPSTPPATPPSMSINMNAQGMENIADILKLIAKVNPDTAPKDAGLPSLSAPPSIMSIKPAEPPMKMLPDLDGDNDDKPGGEMDIDIEPMDKKKDEWANSPNGVEGEPEVKGLDAAIPDGNDLNKPKKTFPKVAGGDNPMQKMESGDLRAQIRAELLQRLEEAKKS
jgi:hypothetical protein